MSKFAVRVDKPRQGIGFTLMFFNLNAGIVHDDGTFEAGLVLTDFQLLRSKAGDLYFKGPQKQRMRKGQPVLNDNDQPIYDELVKMYSEEGAGVDGGYGLTKFSAALRKNIIKQADEAFKAAGLSENANAQRGGTKAPSKAETRAAAAPSTGSKNRSVDDLFGDASGTDVPF